MEPTDIEALRADTLLAGKFWARINAGLSAITFREKGEEAAKRLAVLMLGSIQKGHYLEGLRKLGIRDDEPPAVRAAKYHVLSNEIGGLTVQYIEESPKKAWVRYVAPKGAYRGIAMLAVPGSVSRALSTAWHPKNGQLMGCPRLGWVFTKAMMEMEACDEGYFLEYDRDLAPGEEWRFEPVTKTPAWDPAKQPKLDPKVWPETRILKARRNYARDYVTSTVSTLYQMYGQQTTHHLVRQVMRGVPIQFTQEFRDETGVQGTDVKSVTEVIHRLFRAGNQDVQLIESGGRYRVVLRAHMLFGADASDDLRAAVFEFPVMIARQINGNVSVKRIADGTTEIWEIRDEGRWLW